MFAADFRDRVVHHLLIAHQTRIYEPRFIHDSYACRPGKGVLAASDRLMGFLRSVTANGRRAAWALKLDVASFFPSIDKQILFALLCRHMRDEWSELSRDHPWLRFLVRVDGWRVKPRWRALPTNQAGLDFAVTYRRLARDAGSEVLVLACVGRFVECYGSQRLLGQSLGLPVAAIPRYAYAFLTGTHASRAAAVVRRTIRRGVAVILARPASPSTDLLMPTRQPPRLDRCYHAC